MIRHELTFEENLSRLRAEWSINVDNSGKTELALHFFPEWFTFSVMVYIQSGSPSTRRITLVSVAVRYFDYEIWFFNAMGKRNIKL